MKGAGENRCLRIDLLNWQFSAFLIGVMEMMVSPKTEETLHIYIRRHFEQVSKGTARRFAEQKEAAKAKVVPPPPVK